MNTAHELMEQLQHEGASRFANTGLAGDHTGVARTVRRQRAARATVLSVASVAVAGAAAVGLAHNHDASVAPAGTHTYVTTPPAPTWRLSVTKQEYIGDVIRELATKFSVDEAEARRALVSELPPEANGDPEGWVLATDIDLEGSPNVQGAARRLLVNTVGELESAGIPRTQWRDTVILASIIQQEAPAGQSDQSAVARVLLNRLAAGMPLQVDSAPVRGLGLPTEAIGAFTPEALEAAANPADGDWLFFLRKNDGNVLLFTTYEDFAAAIQGSSPAP